MSGKATKGRAAPVAALLSLFILLSACSRERTWEFYLEDASGNKVNLFLSSGQSARAVYRQDVLFQDAIAFQFFFRDEAGGWKLISLVLEKPKNPAPEVVCDLHAQELPPGSYRVVLFRNDEELSELVFSIVPPLAAPGSAPAVTPRGG